ncbi:MAG TPA: SDR family oxidoreductase [Amycolatopsis sp.]|uniref:SDR family NAD(P)-dependent oxidoreductase n=1 Tax=Amycolatopsis sp. TaxID=37632 RepID=UPI002B49FFFB|nr:SDR family oxidoreductase [Amycolatopsis sp.]HKS49949.1 SDR family oxidoreductase [Amycolatopsis sp.]
MTELSGAGVVITGGGGGIGASLARMFAGEGARVVVADLDGTAVSAVAREVGGAAIVGDAASESGVERLIAEAKDELGTIDLYCANAGVATYGGPDVSEEAWALAWEVNVMAHVRAARLLLPDWLDRGRGHFLATVSAAGLLTMLGSAPYSVTKHGALAFAEWLDATYRHRGITVQALCPQGVRTRMLADTGTVGELIMGATAIEPDQVAEEVRKALEDGRFLILPHAEVAGYYAARATDTDRWLKSMNKLQRKIEALGE